MKSTTWLALAAALLALSGCANFKAVSAFARETANVTSTVRAEFVQVDRICREQAETTIVVGNTDEGPLDACNVHQASMGRFAAVTLDVLDAYAMALAGVADDKAFDLTPELEAIGKEVKAVKDRRGQAVATPEEVTALTRIAEVLADIATAASREAAVRRLVEEQRNLTVAGHILRSFFVPDAGSPATRGGSPYANLVVLVSDAADSSEKILRAPQFRAAEPIRTVELLRDIRARKARLALRSGASAEVPAALVGAIDAWLGALNAFSGEALQPDPEAFLRRIRDLGSKARDARAAIRASDGK